MSKVSVEKKPVVKENPLTYQQVRNTNGRLFRCTDKDTRSRLYSTTFGVIFINIDPEAVSRQVQVVNEAAWEKRTFVEVTDETITITLP